MTARVTAGWGLTALVMSVVALAVALLSTLETGVVAEAAGGHVQAVAPDQAAWAAGIRPGQTVVLLHGADEPGGWELVTREPDGSQHRLSAALLELPLRASAAAAAVGLVLAGASLVAGRRRRRTAELLAAASMLATAVPFAIADPSTLSSVALLVASAGPAVWIARWELRRPAGIALVAGALAAGILALSLRDTGQPVAGVVVQGWAVLVAVSGLAMLALGLGVTRHRAARLLASVRPVDVGVVLAAVAGGIAAIAVGIAPLVVVIGLGLALLVYGRARTGTLDLLDRVVLAEVREGASIRAMEEERARVARELHDDPLQALAGVIRALDDPDPDPLAAGASLRAVAVRLRSVATDLHPPVLDDLGLVPALTAALRADDGIARELELDNATGYTRAERPPADVELAAYRIVVEAVTNASRHSGGSRVRVSGRVAPDQVALVVDDDGVGLDDAALTRALHEGHLGVSSMRQRAAAIGAELELGTSDLGGTAVRLRWRR